MLLGLFKNLAFVLAAYVGIASSYTITYAADPAAISKCISAAVTTAQVQDKDDHTHFPENFSAADKKALIDKFKADGRPILVITDAHYGQKSGVVTVMKVLKEQVEKLTDGKVTIQYVSPDQFHPQVKVKYQDLIFSYMSKKEFKNILAKSNPQAVHVMVEGSLGSRARKYLMQLKIPFTTAYHTMFPEYLKDMVAKWVPKAVAEQVRKIANASLRSFHSASEGVMVPTQSMADSLIAGGYDPKQIRYWSHGVDVDLFRPDMADPKVYEGLQKPISIFMGRVAVEKNIEDFLKMDVPGTKVVIGGGPELEQLKAKYPKAVFLGRKNYEDLPKYYASANTFVFPSVTDTFGLVQLEANATGVPVVAYKVQGPVDVITSPKQGVLADYQPNKPDDNVKNLEAAWHQAQGLSKEGAREIAEEKTWERSTLEFMWFLSRLPNNSPKQPQ